MKYNKNQKGFSLLEILVAISLIAIIMATVGTDVLKQFTEGKEDSARVQIRSFDGPLGQFRRHCHRYPTTEEGLRALVEKPQGGRECKRYAPGGYLKGGEVPLDPWDGEYDYQSSKYNEYTITSAGEDGVLGTEDDISSKDKR